MLRVVPRALEFRFDMRIRAGPRAACRAERATAIEPRSKSPASSLHLPIDRQHEREIHRAPRALRRQVEVTQIDDFVAPKLGAHRLRHAERVDVEDAAANAELRDVFDHRHALEADRFEVFGELAEPVRIALAELDPQLVQRARHSRLLEQRARRREQHPQFAARQPLERLDALAGHLHVRLGLAKAFARRVQRNGRVGHERLQIGEPSLGVRDAFGGDDEEARRQPPRERRDQRGVRRPGQSAGDEPRAGRRQRVENSVKSGQTLDGVEQCVERHQATRGARAPMATASMTSMMSAMISAG